MPVTKTAKRALRVSKRKSSVNSILQAKLLAAIRVAKRDKNKKDVLAAVSLADKAAKSNLIHKNKASRIKSALTKLLPKVKTAPKTVKKTAKKK
jgi:ribosomal protein S20